jgi:hypothetical protein
MPATRRVLAWGNASLLVLLLLGIFTGFLYRRAVGIGVLSDGWVMLEIGSRGLLEAPKVMLSYHTIPVTNLFSAVLWKVFGTWERGYQLTNLAEMVVLAWLIYLLGCKLFRQPRIGLLAALLFVANSSFYEVPFWPVIGNFQTLAAFFYVGGIFAVDRAFRSARPWPWLALFALCVLAGFFTYEPTVSLLFVGFVRAAFWPDGDRRQRLRRAGAVALAAIPILALIAVVKVQAVSAGNSAMFLPDSLWALRFRLHLLVRAVIGIFSLRGSDPAIYYLFSFRTIPPMPSPLYHVFLGGWLLFLAGLGAWLVFKVKEPAVRLLTLWMAIHLAVVGAASGIVSRHFYLAAIPAMLLLAWAIWGLAERAAARLDRSGASSALGLGPEQTAAALALFVLVLLVAGAKNDLNSAAAIHRAATQANRQVSDPVAARRPAKLVLINVPAAMTEDGVSAFSFVNGVHQMLFLKTGMPMADVKLFHTYDQPQAGEYASGTHPATFDELAAWIRDPRALVFLYDPRSRSMREVNRANWTAPERYTPETAPYLEWQSGSWPWMKVYAGQPLDLPLALDGETSWAAIKYLQAPETSFEVEAGGPAPLFEVRPGTRPSSWPMALFPVPSGADSLTFDAAAELWLAKAAGFSPPREYTAESAPFLDWMVRPEAAFLVQAPMRLPLTARECLVQACEVELQFLAEPGREFAVAVEDGSSEQALSFAGAPVEWRSLRLPAGPRGGTIVRITPAGASPVFVRKLVLQAPPPKPVDSAP